MWKSISKRLSKDEATDLPPLVFEEIHFKPSNTYKVIKKIEYMTIHYTTTK